MIAPLLLIFSCSLPVSKTAQQGHEMAPSKSSINSAPHANPQPASAPMTEVERYVQMLSNRVPATETDKAKRWLLQHPESHAVLLDSLRLRGSTAKRILSLLPEFGNPDAVPVLCEILQAEGRLRVDAARALGKHSAPAALACLLSSLDGSVAQKSAALVGLRMRPHQGNCELISALIQDEDSVVRWQALKTVAFLGCLTPVMLQSLQGDESADVRELLDQLTPASDAP